MGKAWNAKKKEMILLIARAKDGDLSAERELQRLAQESKHARKFLERQLRVRERYSRAGPLLGSHQVSGGAFGLGKSRKN